MNQQGPPFLKATQTTCVQSRFRVEGIFSRRNLHRVRSICGGVVIGHESRCFLPEVILLETRGLDSTHLSHFLPVRMFAVEVPIAHSTRGFGNLHRRISLGPRVVQSWPAQAPKWCS